jgi:hypothetical protein
MTAVARSNFILAFFSLTFSFSLAVLYKVDEAFTRMLRIQLGTYINNCLCTFLAAASAVKLLAVERRVCLTFVA